ncbi:dihydroorotase [Acidiluteibacter ferrifornacis]|uniref:Dihydroorotase n=1 Tax=Acidiluteibacter ferrifornacis TaxID=2692424 RepID=A0A6N9NEU3_9FLAO|nr:dihydroorotase [Acidiluteibacter ferrifornacis]NBG65148.1 dihydroorotase [Acidiluteibacter ferrifornacis]
MANTILIKNATIVNEGKQFVGHVLIEGDKIKTVSETEIAIKANREIDATGKLLIPGMIDDQVHFREPGLTHKAEIKTEARAAVAGGITTFMEMPNTVPNTLTQELLQDKYDIAAANSVANYSFFMGASNDNLKEVLKTDPRKVCGVKVFMGSSTGNMLVDSKEVLNHLFQECGMLIATHCEDEATIRANTEYYRNLYGEDLPMKMHPVIRSVEACYKSSSMAIDLAEKYNTRLHILHISTAKETELFRNDIPLSEKRITAEACVHHLWFSDEDYERYGSNIKWNPAVKTAKDRDAIWKAVNDNRIDIIATDHAPHTKEEKANSYFKAPSGGPLVQHALVALLEQYKNGRITLEHLVYKTSHAPAECFQIEKRGYIREGYFADLVLINLDSSWEVNSSNILSKCQWSPFEGTTFSSSIDTTFVSGEIAYENGRVNTSVRGQRLTFER